VHCTKISPEFECQGQRSKVKVTGGKKTKNVTFSSRVVLWGVVLRQFYAGGKNQRMLSGLYNKSKDVM